MSDASGMSQPEKRAKPDGEIGLGPADVVRSDDEDAEWLSARTRELMSERDLKWSRAWHQAERDLLSATGRTPPKLAPRTTSKWLRLALGAAGLGVVALVVVAALATSEDPDGAQRDVDLVSALDIATSSLLIPTGWESELVPVEGDGVGHRSSPNLSSSGTWMLVSVVPHAVSDDDESPEDRFFRFIDQVAEGPLEIVHEPIAVSASGLNGYRYELSGATGDRTGQELGGYLAIFFGPGYNYEVVIQFELSDRDDMSTLFRDTLAGLTLTSDDDPI